MTENEALGRLMVCAMQSGNTEALRVVSDALVAKDERIAVLEAFVRAWDALRNYDGNGETTEQRAAEQAELVHDVKTARAAVGEVEGKL